MQNLLYRIGGYNPEIIKAGQLGPKFLLPGLSLFIVLLTSAYGGWHLADTITTGWLRLPFTIGFISLILLVDYLLLQGEKSKWTVAMRILLSTTMGFIISLLTTLVVFEKDITANINNNLKIQTDTATAGRRVEIVYLKSLLTDSIRHYDVLSTTAHKGDYITENGDKIPKCGPIELEQSYCRTFARKRDNYQTIYDQNKYKIANEDDYIKGKQEEVAARNPNGVIGQIENLWQLMMDEEVVLIGVILFFIFLMVVDLMPVSVKLGIKDQLDEAYQKKIADLEKETDENGNKKWYNSDKERFFTNSQKGRVEREIGRIKEEERAQRIASNIKKLEEAKKEYAEKKLQSLIDKIKGSGNEQQNSRNEDD